MDRDTILQQLEPHEIRILMRLQKPVTTTMDDVVDKWLEAQGLLDNLYAEHTDPTEKKVLNLLIRFGLTQRNEDLSKSQLCIVNTSSLLNPKNPQPSIDTSEDDGATTEETAEQQGETSLQMWARLKPILLDEEQINNCEWIPTDTLEISEMICLCENYFRTQFSRHKHTGGTLESLRLPMKDYIEYIKANSLYQDDYPNKWVRTLINQLIFEGWMFGRESKHDGWTMKPFSRGIIGFPKNLTEHTAALQSGSIDHYQYCTKTEQ
jgi:hypothetical protein